MIEQKHAPEGFYPPVMPEVIAISKFSGFMYF
jgi:hypothetical protein